MTTPSRTSLQPWSLLAGMLLLTVADAAPSQPDPARRIEGAFKPVDIESCYVKGPTWQETLGASISRLRIDNPTFALGQCSLNDHWFRHGPHAVPPGQRAAEVDFKVALTQLDLGAKTPDGTRLWEYEGPVPAGHGTVKSYTRIDRDRFEIEFAVAVPAALEVGDAMENLTWSPDFTVRNTTFGSCRARGLLVSTPGKVVIENNDFVSSGAAILIAGDANGWYESGAVRDVLIRGNRFHPSCLTSWYQFGEGIISILPIIPKPDPEKPFHRNIRIEGNQFDVFDYSLLYALSVDGLSFKDNTINHNTQYKPWQGRKALLTFEGCKAVDVRGNKLADAVLGKNIRIVKMQPAEVTVLPGQGILTLTSEQAHR